MKKLIYPVILAGGSGTRLWPQSREKSPKQFIPLIKGKSLFQETCIRFGNREQFAFPTIITHEEHRFLVRNQLLEIGITDGCIITEPEAKNTAAACISGAHFLQKKIGNVPILFTPADHVVLDSTPLYIALRDALPFVNDGALCIFGIKPSSPHTGYGYITKGNLLGTSIYKPTAFIEKPTADIAEKLINSGALWNSGLYFCTPETLISEANTHTPDTQRVLEKFMTALEIDKYGFYMIDNTVYNSIPSISIDKGITERSAVLIIAETPIAWSDLGSWKALHEHFDKNDHGNVLRGDSIVLDTKNSYIESSSRLVTVLGLESIGVVETPDAILVFPLNESESVRTIVKKLEESKRDELSTHTLVQRPWGSYKILAKEGHFNSKKLTVLPGAELSLQRHKRRAEHWVVVQGVATVTKDGEVFELKKNESTFLPMGTTHRLQNKSDEVLQIIEVQTGDYFGEDDIERFEDTYGRSM